MLTRLILTVPRDCLAKQLVLNGRCCSAFSLNSCRRGVQAAAESPEEGTDTAAALVGAMEAACEERRGVLRPPRSASLFGATKPSAELEI